MLFLNHVDEKLLKLKNSEIDEGMTPKQVNFRLLKPSYLYKFPLDTAFAPKLIAMPSVDISVNQLIDIFAKDRDTPATVSTSLGHVMIEIQGDLQHPQKSIEPALDVDSRFIEHDGNGLVRFGILSYDLETKHVTLFIGNKQRLMGSIVKIEPPLGLLKFDKVNGTVSLRDVLKYKIIFKNRPLPIM